MKRDLEAENKMLLDLIKEMFGGALYYSCFYSDHDDANPCWHCCDWSDWSKRVAPLIGVILQDEEEGDK